MPTPEDAGTVQPSASAAHTIVFTIVSRNYFHYARNLMASVAEHMPLTQRVVVICDALDGLPADDQSVELLGIESLGIGALDRMALHYTILELNTAIKPFAFERLFERPGVQRVVYFDPDIQLFASGTPLLQRLDAADVVLTPHLLAPLADDKSPSDLAIVQSGTYNLGFLALARGTHTLALLRWWQDKLVRDCVVDIPRGLFTDQKWMDLVPGLYPRVYIERHPGWNVAYWNLLHRKVSTDAAGCYLVSGEPLFFFHFSGYDPKSALISKHQDRFKLSDCTTAAQTLFAAYAQRLQSFGRDRFAALPYAFATLADGTRIPDIARALIRNQLPDLPHMPDLRSTAGARFVIRFLTEAVDERKPAVSRLAHQLWAQRADLRAAFPDVLGSHREAYMNWFTERAGPEAGIAGVLARPGTDPAFAPAPLVVDVDHPSPAASPPALAFEPKTAGTTPTEMAMVKAALALPVPAAAAPSATATSAPFRMMYRMAWRARNVLRPMTSLSFRNRMRETLIQRAFPSTPFSAVTASAVMQNGAAQRGDAQSTYPGGVTVIGYLHAESGVGESARATLRALRQSGVPHSLRDYRVGNVSRMSEHVDEGLATNKQHAVSLFHINADQLPLARSFLGESAFQAPYRIGFWAWELEDFPAEWHGAFAHVDEVWVPSTFCQRAIAAVSPVPVLVLPHAVEIPSNSTPDRARFGLRPGSIAFLAMADMMSMASRKNPFGALQAFAAAFRGSEHNAELVVKISNAERDPEAFLRLQALAASCPGIHLLADYLDRASIYSLIDSVDCFVSMHRSEGFGLVIAEAMARGKVVLATGWSGNCDFTTPTNSLPLDYRLVALEHDVGPYRQGQRWAEPSLDDAVVKLRQVAQDPAMRHRLGQRAREHCRLHLSPAVVGAMQRQRLQVLHQRQGLSLTLLPLAVEA